MAEALSPPPPLIPFLPDEISILCIARVPVTSHTAIAQVSRSWRSFVRSPSFSSVRSKLAVTELVLTVGIFDYSECRRRWYHLHPYQTPFPLPQIVTEEHNDEASVSVSLGPHLFCIGGYSSPNSVQIYDGCLRRWSHGPPTSIPCKFADAGVAGGRIHVIGGCRVPPSAPSAESLDPAGTRWDSVPPIPAHLFGKRWYNSGVVDGKLLVISKGDSQLFGAAFDPDTAEWVHVPPWWVDTVSFTSPSVVGGVPYVLQDDMFGYGRPVEGRSENRILRYGNDGQWRPVEGESVTELLHRMPEVRLLTFGDLLCLKGKETEPRDGFTVQIFAGIDISRTVDGGFRGYIMWLDSSLKLSEEENQDIDQCVVLEL